VVERTLAWLSRNRRLAKDYERRPETGEIFIYMAMSLYGHEPHFAQKARQMPENIASKFSLISDTFHSTPSNITVALPN
jgi:hypothetical protein